MHEDGAQGAGRGAQAAAPGWVDGLMARGQVLGRPDPKRAKQFMPFAALRGYYELIHEKERVPEERRDLAQEDRERLSRKLAQVRRGAMVTVTYYDGDAYVTTTGLVARVDPDAQALTVVKRQIPYADLLDICGEGIPEDDLW